MADRANVRGFGTGPIFLAVSQLKRRRGNVRLVGTVSKAAEGQHAIELGRRFSHSVMSGMRLDAIA